MDQNDAGSSNRHDEDAGQDAPHRGRGVRLVDWVNGHLISALGPPPVGPYGEVEASVPGVCPVCGHPMGEHLIDRSTPNTILTCPVEFGHQFEKIDTLPLNEVGQPKRPAE